MNEQSLPTNLQSAETGSLVYVEGWSYNLTTYEHSLLGKSCLVISSKTEPTQSHNKYCQHFGYGDTDDGTPKEMCVNGFVVCASCQGRGAMEWGECGSCQGNGCLNGIVNDFDECPVCNGKSTWKNITTIELQPLGETKHQEVKMNADGTTYSFEWAQT